MDHIPQVVSAHNLVKVTQRSGSRWGGDLFIGAGGTMTRETAVFSIPTISIYQDQLLQVDEYLIKMGFMIHQKNIDAKFIIGFLKKISPQKANKQLLNKGKQAYDLIRTTLLANEKLE